MIKNLLASAGDGQDLVTKHTHIPIKLFIKVTLKFKFPIFSIWHKILFFLLTFSNHWKSKNPLELTGLIKTSLGFNLAHGHGFQSSGPSMPLRRASSGCKLSCRGAQSSYLPFSLSKLFQGLDWESQGHRKGGRHPACPQGTFHPMEGGPKEDSDTKSRKVRIVRETLPCPVNKKVHHAI